MAKKRQQLVYSTRPDAEVSQRTAAKITKSLPPQQQDIRVRLDRKKRRGKVVTVVGGFQLNPADLKALGKQLKQYCGAGGAIKDNEIEIQGEHRDKIVQKLASLGYKVKKAGG